MEGIFIERRKQSTGKYLHKVDGKQYAWTPT